MSTQASVRALACIALCLVCLLLATGCGEQDSSSRADEPATVDDSSASAPTSSAAATTPTQSPSETASSSEPTSTGSPAGLTGRLLGAGEVPGFNADYRWRQGATRAGEPKGGFGTCQRFAMTAVGAEKVVSRDFRPAVGGAVAGKDGAGELVAQFPDDITARRAFAVLTAWRSRCQDRLTSFKRSDIGSLENVSVGGGRAGWYLLTYGPVQGDPEAQFFDAQGMAVVGSRIAMVSMVLAGQDYNYEPGQEPMVATVQRAARKLS